MASTDYAVRINVQQGTLEVTGPDKAWVDAKIGELRPLLEQVGAGEAPSGAAASSRKKPAKRRAAAKEASSPADPSKAARKPRNASGRSAVNADLKGKLDATTRKKLEGFVAKRRKAWDGSQSAQAAIIATFLQDELGMEGVDKDDLYTVYTVMGERSPANIKSQLTNAQQRARYFAGRDAAGKLVLSHAGENFGRFDAVDSADDAG